MDGRNQGNAVVLADIQAPAAERVRRFRALYREAESRRIAGGSSAVTCSCSSVIPCKVPTLFRGVTRFCLGGGGRCTFFLLANNSISEFGLDSCR